MSARAFVRAASGATLLSLAPLAVFAGACESRPAPSQAVVPPANNVAAARPILPVDHLANDELLEGTEKVFGLTLPRGVHIDEAFADTIYASGSVGVHPFTQYLRARLQDGALREGEAASTFEHVSIPGQPGHEFQIHTGRGVGGLRIEIRDTTPPALLNLPDDRARWKEVGLTPDGHLIDPTHLD